MEQTYLSISSFLDNESVLITGATGFIGKAIVEKILRSCPGVQSIYILAREKKNLHAAGRLQELLNTTLFNRVRADAPEVLRKVVPVSGDVSLQNLGLTVEDKHRLENVTVVYHSAANVNFNADLRSMLKHNVEGTKNMISWAMGLKKLKAFVYVSTAFCNPGPIIRETVYHSDVDPHVAISLYDGLPEDVMEPVAQLLKQRHNGLYALSKHLAENVIHGARFVLPVCIVRPSTGSYNEPFPGWVDTLTGVTGFLASRSAGIVRCHYANKRKTFDFVPVDFLVNMILAASWNLAGGDRGEDNMTVYNYCSSTDNPFFFGVHEMRAFELYPLNRIFWYPSAITTANRTMFHTLHWLINYPLILVAEGAIKLTGRTTSVSIGRAYAKTKQMMDVTRAVTVTDWKFHTENVQKLFEKLDTADKAIFDFNIKNINMELFVQRIVYGIRRFIACQDDCDLEKARQNFRRYKFFYQLSWFFGLLTLLTTGGLVAWKIIETF